MFTHDPFQAFQNPGAFGGATPYGLPYAGIHPLALAMQQNLANPGIGGLGHYGQQNLGYPQQLQGIAAQQNPWQQFQGWNPLAAGLQNPLQQQHHQLGHFGLQNPLQNPFLNPMLAYQGWQQGQMGYPLAPQSFIGGQGIGQPYNQINPLAQLALRQSGFGFSPYGSY